MRYQEPDDGHWMGKSHWSLLDERPAEGDAYPGPFYYFSLVGLLSFLQALVWTVHRIESVHLCSQLGVPTTLSHAAFCRQAPPCVCAPVWTWAWKSEVNIKCFLYHFFSCARVFYWSWNTDSEDQQTLVSSSPALDLQVHVSTLPASSADCRDLNSDLQACSVGALLTKLSPHPLRILSVKAEQMGEADDQFFWNELLQLMKTWDQY